MVRAKVIKQKARRLRRVAAKQPVREVKPAAPAAIDRQRAFQDAIADLRDHADQYAREADLGSVIRKILNRVGVPVTDAQANSVCGAVGVDGRLRPTDTDSLRSAMGRASKSLPKNGPSLEDLMKQMKPK